MRQTGIVNMPQLKILGGMLRHVLSSLVGVVSLSERPFFRLAVAVRPLSLVAASIEWLLDR